MDGPPDWGSEYVTVGRGDSWHCVTWSGSADETLLLVHGFTDNWQCLVPLASGCTDVCNLVLCDIPGHGTTRVPDGDYSPENLVAGIEDICRTYDIDFLYGHSLGAELSARAVRDGDVGVDRLVLEDPPASLVEHELASDNEGIDRDITRWRTATHEEIRREYESEYPSFADALATARKQFHPEVQDVVSELTHEPLPDLLPQVPVETLVLRPDPAVVDYLDRSRDSRWEQRHENATVRYVDGAGHTIIRDNFAESLSLIREHLTQ